MTDHAAEHLAHALRDLADAVRHAGGTQLILHRINELESKIMSKITDFATAQQAFNDQQSAAIDGITSSITGLQGDIAALNQKITDLQNSPGTITPEDQALLDSLQAQGGTISSRLQSVASALATLDAQTPPTPPTV